MNGFESEAKNVQKSWAYGHEISSKRVTFRLGVKYTSKTVIKPFVLNEICIFGKNLVVFLRLRLALSQKGFNQNTQFLAIPTNGLGVGFKSGPPLKLNKNSELIQAVNLTAYLRGQKPS